MFKYVLISLLITGLLVSCSDDDDMDMEMEEEMEMSVDITTMVLGTYTGLSSFTEGGSSFTEENRVATVTMVSDSVANIRISPQLAGTIEFEAILSSESAFSMENVTVIDEPYSGTGSVDGDTLTISLATGNKTFTYVGTK